ncbi:hypothetical protein PQR05_29300 [Paraburkholderia sediminicola]|uniref:phage head spike fiber domain-containing protein n=1 Tax=Paraburkholderia sediminicola TaxID=458836 RepID=UPI0038B9B509
MTNPLHPFDAPDLQPLRNSFEYDQLEAEMKDAFMAVFNKYIRPAERQANLIGMPHLGDSDLIERTLKDYGLSIVKRDATRTAFLLKAARARNPRRGMIFLRQYLQSVWPGVWKVEPLWHPIATADVYPEQRSARTRIDITPAVQAVYDASSEDGLPLVYRTDWQGRMQLYTKPRTNLFLNSTADTGSAGKGKWALGGNATRIGNVVGPDASNNAVAYSCQALGGCYVTHTLSLTQGKTYTFSVWARIGSGTPNAGKLLNVNNTYSLNVVGSGLSSQWQRFSMTFTATAAGSYGAAVPIYLATDYGVGTGIQLFGAQIENDGVVTSLIPTTTAPVTATDYTMNADGMATFADGVTPKTPLTYFRTGRIRVTLPVSSDNGLGLIEIAKAFRSVLAARLMIELQLSTIFENIGAETHGLAIAGAAKGVMPFMAIGTLKK